MSGIWWAPQMFSRGLQPVEVKKKQHWLGPSDTPVEIDVELPDATGSGAVHIKLVPERVGQVDGFSDEKIDPVKSAESDDEQDGVHDDGQEDLHEDF